MKTLLKFILLATLIVSCNNDDRIPDPKTCEMEFEDLGFDDNTYLGTYGWKLMGDTLKMNYAFDGYGHHGGYNSQNHFFKIDTVNNCISHIKSQYKLLLMYEKIDTIYTNATEYDIVTSYPHFYNVDKQFENKKLKIQYFEIGNRIALEIQNIQGEVIYPDDSYIGYGVDYNNKLEVLFFEMNLFNDYEAIWNELP